MGNNPTLPQGFGYKSSNSPFFTPVKNAVISARVYISAGPDGCRELRTAIAPSGSSATSTQLPLGLLTALLRQAAETSWSAWMPLLNCIVLLASHFVGMGSLRGRAHGQGVHGLRRAA